MALSAFVPTGHDMWLVGWWVDGLVGWCVGLLVGWWVGGLVGWWVGGLVCSCGVHLEGRRGIERHREGEEGEEGEEG